MQCLQPAGPRGCLSHPSTSFSIQDATRIGKVHGGALSCLSFKLLIMLDLAFVRANLPLVEEKLRARGADPSALLGDFLLLDRRRREAITLAEQAKARRNELSQQIGTLRKAGPGGADEAGALME